MTLPRTYRAVGLTLRKTPVGESDLVSTLYTREHGKIEARARGARRLTSRLMGHFEPLTLLRLAVARGRALDVVAEAEVITAFPAVKTDYATAARGLYVAELMDAFSVPAVANPELFDLARHTLDAIGGDLSSEMALRYFDLHLLRRSGFLPELYCCVECGAELEPARHRYAAGAGGTLCLDCVTSPEVIVRPLSLPALKVLRMLHRAETAFQLPELRIPAKIRNEVHGVLAATVQYWLDRQVKSQVFLEAAKLA